MKSSSAACTLLITLLLLPFQVSAFVVSRTGVSSPTVAFASTIYSDFENTRSNRPLAAPERNLQDDLTKYTEPVIVKRASLQAMDLPRHGPTASEKEIAKLLESAEAITGRAAMLAALVLMTTEVTTGMSLPEQLSKMLS